MVSLLDGCSDGCGWAAAVLAVFAWGTFGVPLKAVQVNSNMEVNFFVLQSYKTLVCFATSFLVVFLGEPIRWTPWGIVSGIFWVPGAACGIYGIRNAGIAIAVGTWSSITVVSSCIFGIIVFQEKFKDTQQTLLAIFTLIMGLIGMSRYSETTSSFTSNKRVDSSNNSTTHETTSKKDTANVLSTKAFPKEPSTTDATPRTSKRKIKGKRKNSNNATAELVVAAVADLGEPAPSSSSLSPLEIETLFLEEQATAPLIKKYDKTKDRTSSDIIVLFSGRLSLTRRQLGILGAVVNGAWGGLSLIPLHYAQRDQGLSGASYLISYGTGSMLVCIFIWIGLFVYYFIRREFSVSDALNDLPAFHIEELGVPGLLAGTFYSIGNFCSILAVTYLGQGVGFSFCQGQLLISGLWGVFYFKEIRGRGTIAKWFISATVTIIGIIWLSFQHEKDGGGGES